MYLVQITYNFEFLMVKLISFIVLTHFFQFNELKILTVFFTVQKLSDGNF